MNKEIKKKYYMNYTPSGKLPSEYQEVEYIQGDTNNRTMYINTKVKRNNLPISFDLDIQILSGLSTSTYYWLVYMENWNTSQDGVIFGAYSNEWKVLKSGVNVYNMTSNNTNRTQFIYSHNTESNVSLSGDYTANTTISASGTNYNNDEISLIANGYKIYACKIYSNEVLVRDFIPCYRKSDYRVGLYDLCGSDSGDGTPFYTNSGSGEFLSGVDIVKVDGYRQVEYIESSGSGDTAMQYIDTGYIANANTGADYTFEYGTNGITTYGRHILSGSGYYFPLFRNMSSSKFYVSRWNFALNLTSPSGVVGQKYNFRAFVNDDNAYLNGVSLGTCSSTGAETDRGNLFLFAYNNSGSAGANAIGKLYNCFIYESGTRVRNFIPMERIDDNELGLYDTINKVFYTNQGSGTFTKGNYIGTQL